MAKKRAALRALPKHDPDNNIGVVDRVRFAMAHARMNALTVDEAAQFKRWQQINDWIRDRRYVDEFAPGLEKPTKMISSHRILRNLVMGTFGMTWDTAERDIRNSKQVFLPIDDDNEYYRSVYIEQFEQRADEAAALGDYSGSAKYAELAVKLRRLLEAPKEQIEYEMWLRSAPALRDVAQVGLTSADAILRAWKAAAPPRPEIGRDGAR